MDEEAATAANEEAATTANEEAAISSAKGAAAETQLAPMQSSSLAAAASALALKVKVVGDKYFRELVLPQPLELNGLRLAVAKKLKLGTNETQLHLADGTQLQQQHQPQPLTHHTEVTAVPEHD